MRILLGTVSDSCFCYCYPDAWYSLLSLVKIIFCPFALSVVENLIFITAEIRPSVSNNIYDKNTKTDCCNFLFRISVLQVPCNCVFPPFTAIGALRRMRPRATTAATQTPEASVCFPICI